MEKWGNEPDLTTPHLLSGYFRELCANIVRSDYQRACLVGKLTVELAASYDAFQEQLRSDLAAWKQQLRVLLERGQQRGDVRADQQAEVMADAVLALIQGAFVVALASHDSAALHSVGQSLELLVTPPIPH